MYRFDYETMTFEHTSNFRHLLRKFYCQIQEICYFYHNSNFQIDYFLTFAKQIDETMSQILNLTQFSQRRKPIEEFHQFLIQFQNTFQSHYDDFFINIKESLSKILGPQSQVILQFDQIVIKNSSNWENFCESLEKAKFDSNLELKKEISIIFSKGKAVSLICDLIPILEQFYINLPREMTDAEREKFILNRRISQLEEEVALLKSQKKDWQSKYESLNSIYKKTEESYEKTKQELKEIKHLKEYSDVQIRQIKELFTKYRKQIDDEDEEFDPDSFAQFIKNNQEEFDDIMYELDL